MGTHGFHGSGRLTGLGTSIHQAHVYIPGTMLGALYNILFSPQNEPNQKLPLFPFYIGENQNSEKLGFKSRPVLLQNLRSFYYSTVLLQVV